MAPLLNWSISGIQVGLHGRIEAFSTVVNFSLAATTYNSRFDVWEPLIETSDALVRCVLLIRIKHSVSNVAVVEIAAI